MIEFEHSDVGSIRCPLHNQREAFTAGLIIQPTDPSLVRYPCGYVDGLTSKMGFDPAVPVPNKDELTKELITRLEQLEQRGAPRRTPAFTAPQSPAKKGGVAL